MVDAGSGSVPEQLLPGDQPSQGQQGSARDDGHCMSEGRPPAGGEGTAAALSRGVCGLLQPLVNEVDLNVVSLRRAQKELTAEIERLMAELQVFHETAAALPPLQPVVAKLANAQSRLAAASSTIKSVQDRVVRLHALLGGT